MCFWGAGAEPSALERALAEEGQDISLEGTVYKVEEKAKVTAVYMKDNAVSAASQKFNESKIMVYIRPDHTEIKIGNKVKMSGEASAFEPARNPGNFDQRAYYIRQGRSSQTKQTRYSSFFQNCAPAGRKCSLSILENITEGP